MSQLSFPQILAALSYGGWGWQLSRSSAPGKANLTLAIPIQTFRLIGASELLEVPLDDDGTAAILIARAMMRLDPDDATAPTLVPMGYQRYTLDMEPGA